MKTRAALGSLCMLLTGALLWQCGGDAIETSAADAGGADAGPDCAGDPACTGGEPLFVFYVVHVHGPEGRPEFQPATQEEYLGVARTVRRLADTLEDHGAKGTFEILQLVADGAVQYEGASDNLLVELARRGHEVAAHAHSFQDDQWRRTSAAIAAAGVQPPTTLGARGSIDMAASAGYTALTDNFNPLDSHAPPEIANCADWGLGGNTVYPRTWNLPHPWRPDATSVPSFCLHDPDGPLVYVDHVGGDWLTNGCTTSAGPFTSCHFDKLRPYFEAAVALDRQDRITAWGWVSHEVEYCVGGHQGYDGTAPVDETAIAALEAFLGYIEGRGSGVSWATVGEIVQAFGQWEASR
ncbi:MAG: hypothetical protein HY906_21240 [Deltaproteobacteria bacterium]|nr:hypothetical protein [Deltaproteobacteria bacterium]